MQLIQQLWEFEEVIATTLEEMGARLEEMQKRLNKVSSFIDKNQKAESQSNAARVKRDISMATPRPTLLQKVLSKSLTPAKLQQTEHQQSFDLSISQVCSPPVTMTFTLPNNIDESSDPFDSSKTSKIYSPPIHFHFNSDSISRSDDSSMPSTPKIHAFTLGLEELAIITPETRVTKDMNQLSISGSFRQLKPQYEQNDSFYMPFDEYMNDASSKKENEKLTLDDVDLSMDELNQQENLILHGLKSTAKRKKRNGLRILCGDEGISPSERCREPSNYKEFNQSDFPSAFQVFLGLIR